jgi:hypothetical protein
MDGVAVFRDFAAGLRRAAGLLTAVRAATFRVVALRAAAFRAAAGRATRFAAAFCLDFAAARRRPAAVFLLAVRFRPAAGPFPDRAVLRFRLLARAPFRFAITRSFRVASDPRLTLTVPGK